MNDLQHQSPQNSAFLKKVSDMPTYEKSAEMTLPERFEFERLLTELFATFINVNCASLPPTLIESELFGHEKGAFTGAYARRKGRFELADGATFFLDEIGELPLASQGKLLTVLESGEFERVGSSSTIQVDARIIVATNRDLEQEVKSGNFRQDLWYRLNVFSIKMPPLRQRREDIPLLVNWMLNKVCKQLGKQIDRVPAGTMNALEMYTWPGNIRELQNVIERSIINTQGNVLRLADSLEINNDLFSEGPGKTIDEKLEPSDFSHAAHYMP